MTGSTSRVSAFAMPRGDLKPAPRTATAPAAGSPIARRLKAFFLGRRREARPVPPLKNAHYIAVHMVAAAHRESLR